MTFSFPTLTLTLEISVPKMKEYAPFLRDVSHTTVIEVLTENPEPATIEYLIMDLNAGDDVEVYRAKLNGMTLSAYSQFVSVYVKEVEELKFLVLEIAANVDPAYRNTKQSLKIKLRDVPEDHDTEALFSRLYTFDFVFVSSEREEENNEDDIQNFGNS